MGLLKFMIVGAAVGYGLKYITKKGANGRSILDDLTDNAPDWFDHAKKYAEDNLEHVIQRVQPANNH